MVIFINQIRMKIGVMFGIPETTTGGNALKFYASVRLDIRRIGAIKDRDEVVGNQTRVKVVKNKVAPPFKQVEFDIMYGEGMSKAGELLDLGVKAGVVEKSGAWFSYNSQRIGQGRENAKLFLRDNPDIADEIETALRQNAGLIAEKFLDNGGAEADDDGFEERPARCRRRADAQPRIGRPAIRAANRVCVSASRSRRPSRRRSSFAAAGADAGRLRTRPRPRFWTASRHGAKRPCPSSGQAMSAGWRRFSRKGSMHERRERHPVGLSRLFPAATATRSCRRARWCRATTRR